MELFSAGVDFVTRLHKHFAKFVIGQLHLVICALTTFKNANVAMWFYVTVANTVVLM